jgi:hypothetical protein
MYVVADRWKVKDINGRLKKDGEHIELSEKDAARLLKTGVIREVSHNAKDDGDSADGHDAGETGEDSGEDADDADGISADGGDISLSQEGAPDDGTGKKPKSQARRGK